MNKEVVLALRKPKSFMLAVTDTGCGMDAKTADLSGCTPSLESVPLLDRYQHDTGLSCVLFGTVPDRQAARNYNPSM